MGRSTASNRSQPMLNVSAKDARRLLMQGQGLLDDPAVPASSDRVRNIIRQLCFVQVDSINMVERAHHHILLTRCDEYEHDMLRALLEDERNMFEHWTHDASIVPVEYLPHWRVRFQRYRERANKRKDNWWTQRFGELPDRTLEHVVERIEREGALFSRDFAHDRNGEAGGWWSWKPQKFALEHLWRTGELVISHRVNFQKAYDLPHRVFDGFEKIEATDDEAHVDWACSTALDRLGVATSTEIAAFFGAVTLAEARRWCKERCQSGAILLVQCASADGGPPRDAFAPIDIEDRIAALPPAPKRMRLLSPFDPLIRDRGRAQRLFDFDYRFEAFVPAAKRKYGYYVLPILDGDRLVGRVNPKFHRDRDELVVDGVWWEPHLKPSKAHEKRLDEAINRFACGIGASYWSR